jgi:uncharacterized alpha/beta hydrolase family protein
LKEEEKNYNILTSLTFIIIIIIIIFENTTNQQQQQKKEKANNKNQYSICKYYITGRFSFKFLLI